MTITEQESPWRFVPQLDYKASECPLCSGQGKLFSGDLLAPVGDSYTCPECKGYGLHRLARREGEG